MSTCQEVNDELSLLVDGDRDAIARHGEHLASCDACRDARHEATRVASLLASAGADHAPSADVVARLEAALDREAPATPVAPAAVIHERSFSKSDERSFSKSNDVKVLPIRRRTWIVPVAGFAIAASAAGVYFLRGHAGSSPIATSDGSIGHVTTVSRAASDHADGVTIATSIGGTARPIRVNDPLPDAGMLRTDERTRASIELADGTKLVLDHQTTVLFERGEPRHVRLAAGRLLADVVHVDGRPAQIATPSGTIDVVGTRFVVTATDALTSVQVVRGQVVLTGNGMHDDVRAGEEGTLEAGKLAVNPVPSLAREVEWAELGSQQQDETTAGLGALRAYKPGESRDRDWKLKLASHDVKVRIVGPIARTEITETFRNDSAAELEGVYQFPLPADAQIDGLALDVKGAMVDGAFVDKERGAKIWKGVIDKATPHHQEIASDIIWVNGSWRDPALLDWKRGGRFELRVFPIPANGQRTIKLAYTQVVAPRGPWRQYVYPLPHSKDGSTVADRVSMDVEIRGASAGLVRTVGYDLVPDATRNDVNRLTFSQAGFVPRGDLVIGYHATDGAAELRAWTFAGASAVAPDAKLADTKNVGIDPKVVEAQRVEAADDRPTAVIALRPNLPRWRETKPRDYMIVLDASQSMVGERFARATELATTIVDQMDRRDRFSVMTCDSDCRSFGELRAPTPDAAAQARTWLATQTAAGATDLVASVRAARAALPDGDRDRWVLYVGDGFATTGFRRVADVEQALAGGTVRVTTIGIGGDADAPLLEAAARGAGGSFLAWLPGARVATVAVAALESTYGSALEHAKVELPAGLADVAPTVLPTVRGGDEVLLAARVTGAVDGMVVVTGTVAGQPFEQRYPLKLAVSNAPGNGFVPRLWASLAIDQRERAGAGEDRAKIVALSQAYGVMSRETSLLVLESPAMFDAFGVDRHVPTAKWTGEEALDEVASAGTMPVGNTKDTMALATGNAGTTATMAPAKPASTPPMEKTANVPRAGAGAVRRPPMDPANGGFGGGDYWNPNQFAMRRTWVRVPSVTAYDTVSPSIVAAIGNAERALQASPDSREKHRALVQALSYAGELDRARDVAAKWLDRDRLDPQALGYQADLLGRAGQRELALRTLAGLVDLDADRIALHERMVQAYDQVGRAQQACSHRIALAALAPKAAKPAADAMRCLRSTGQPSDAELIVRALPDDATRAAAEQAANVAPSAPKLAGDLVVAAHWDGGADLDLSLVTPDGTRVSWMGGRSDALVVDATSTDRESLAIKSLKRGNYLIEIARGTPSTNAVRGALDITVLGAKKTLPFELRGEHAVVGRISIGLEERLEQVDLVPGHVTIGAIGQDEARRVILARSPSVRQCYQRELNTNPTLTGRVMLTITIDPNTGVSIQTSASGGMEQVAECAKQQLTSMHVGVAGRTILRVPLTFSP